MAIILNEVKYAEDMYLNGKLGQKPLAVLNVIARYLRQKKEFKPLALTHELDLFMERYYPNYNPDLWEDRIEKIVRLSNQYPLREIDYVGITQRELDTIKLLSQLKYQQVTFALLCYSKFYNATLKENHDWANIDFIDIFKIAGIRTRNRAEKCEMIHNLCQSPPQNTQPLIALSKRNTNMNVQVLFVDHIGDPVLKISDFRELGKEFLSYYNPDDYSRCTLCGLLIKKQGRKKSKFCPACAISENRRKARERKKFEKV